MATTPPLKISDEQFAALKSKLAELLKNNCPMCSHSKLALMDRLVNLPLQVSPQSMALGGASLPSAVTVCERCGFTSFHNLFVLGLQKEFGIVSRKEQKEEEAQNA